MYMVQESTKLDTTHLYHNPIYHEEMVSLDISCIQVTDYDYTTQQLALAVNGPTHQVWTQLN